MRKVICAAVILGLLLSSVSAWATNKKEGGFDAQPASIYGKSDASATMVVPVLVDTSGNLYIKLNPGSSVRSGQKTVSIAGTAEALGTTLSIISVTIKAKAANTNNVYVGNDGAGDITSSNGYVLDAGETVTIDTDNLADIWLDVDTGGEGVSYIALIE